MAGWLEAGQVAGGRWLEAGDWWQMVGRGLEGGWRQVAGVSTEPPHYNHA